MENNNKATIKLTEYAKSAGCAAKIPPGTLENILKSLPKNEDERLLVGTETSDDACVWKIDDNTAIVKTLDFFPPVVDEPYIYGQIAATNALSDVFAMGAEAILALNIVSFPSCLGVDILEEILKGGSEKVKEAGAVIAGGHSINTNEIIYGLSVTGIINPKNIRKNCGAKNGDVLVLTKKIGTGVINTAIKAGLASADAKSDAIKSMTKLNMYAKRALDSLMVNASTDITGFSLAGHAREMAIGSNVSIYIESSKIPLFAETLEYANMGLIPQGTYNNRNFISKDLKFETPTLSETMSDIIFDPQTSGGLLVSLSESEAEKLIKKLKEIDEECYIIGKVKAFDGTRLHII